MESIIKGFLGIFFTVIIAATGIGILTAVIETASAERALSRYCSAIEDSHFSPEVIEACCRDAKEDKRSLVVESGIRSGESFTSYGTAVLNYEISIPIVGIEKELSIKSPLR